MANSIRDARVRGLMTRLVEHMVLYKIASEIDSLGYLPSNEGSTVNSQL